MSAIKGEHVDGTCSWSMLSKDLSKGMDWQRGMKEKG